jgi:pimeloyl-ACP methyl ester carboxylesterase
MQIDVNGCTLYYEKVGAGQPLILLHGNGETHLIFDKAVELLRDHFTVYLLDSRGHGQSSKISSFHYADMAEDVRCFIEALHLPSPLLYGFSDGGIIGLLLASSYPSLLAGLIVSGANTEPSGLKPFWRSLFRLVGHITKDPKITLMLQEPHITKEQLAAITIPTLVLAGSHDLIAEAHTRRIAAAIPGGSLRILPGEGHGSYVVHRKKIASLILEYTKTIAGAMLTPTV